MAVQGRHVFLIVSAIGFVVTLVVMVIALRQGEAIMRTGDRPAAPPITDLGTLPKGAAP